MNPDPAFSFESNEGLMKFNNKLNSTLLAGSIRRYKYSIWSSRVLHDRRNRSLTVWAITSTDVWCTMKAI